MNREEELRGLQYAAETAIRQGKPGNAAPILQTVQDSYYLAVMDRPRELGKIEPRVMDGHFFTGPGAQQRATGMLNQLKDSGLTVFLFQQVSGESIPYSKDDKPK